MTGEEPISSRDQKDALSGFAQRLKNIGFGFLVVMAFILACRVFSH
jgi:hypothetical protein